MPNAAAAPAGGEPVPSFYDSVVVATNVQPVPKVAPKIPYNPWSCVSYAKYKRPDQNFIWGTPSKVEAYDIEPFVGALVITTESRPRTNTGHVAYVESITDTTLTVSEANYVAGLVTRRVIPRDAPYIRGYR